MPVIFSCSEALTADSFCRAKIKDCRCFLLPVIDKPEIERHHHQRDKRQIKVHRQHDDDDSDKADDFTHHPESAGIQKVAHLTDVVLGAGHNAPRLVMVEKADGEALQMTEDLPAQTEQNALPDDRLRPDLPPVSHQVEQGVADETA